jgi:hypothetical protein
MEGMVAMDRTLLDSGAIAIGAIGGSGNVSVLEFMLLPRANELTASPLT